MIVLVTADDKKFRSEKIAEIIATAHDSEIITIDDTMMELGELEQFLFPSLFFSSPIVHAKFIVDTGILDTVLIKKFSASPTVFLFEELSLPLPVVTSLKKGGAIIHQGEKQKAAKNSEDLFSIVGSIVVGEKKQRWLAYRHAIERYPVEALLGILYWKIKTLAAKEKTQGTYRKLYQTILSAHVRAWRRGTPLELLIEKALLA